MKGNNAEQQSTAKCPVQVEHNLDDRCTQSLTHGLNALWQYMAVSETLSRNTCRQIWRSMAFPFF